MSRGASTVLALVFTCCSATTAAPPASSSAAPVRGGVLVQAIGQDITTLQPLLATESTTAEVADLLYDRLWNPDPRTGEARPHLATWEVSADARTYSWQIASNAMWSDGRPIVAEDVRTTLKAYGRRRTTGARFGAIAGFADYAAGRSDQIAGFAADQADPRRFSVTLTGSSCSLPLFNLYPLPAHVFGGYLDRSPGWTPERFERAAENDQPTVVSGPFMLDEWRRNDQIALKRNAAYWRGTPLLDGFVLRVVPVEAWPEQLQAGRVGFAALVAQHRDAFKGVLARDPALRLHVTADNGYLAIAWNTRSSTAPALRDRRVRQALAYGLDGDLALKSLRDGNGERALSHHIPSFWAHTDGLDPYSYDPARARRLIEDAGYAIGRDGLYERDGATLSITLEVQTDNPERASLVQFAADQYRRIGIRTTLVTRPFQQLLLRVLAGEYDGAVLGFIVPPDGDPYGLWHSDSISDPATGKAGNNVSRFGSSTVDAAIEAARSGPDCTTAKRKKVYEAFNRTLNYEQPFYFAFTGLRVRAVRADLRGFDPPIYGNDTYDVQRWWIAK